jgi:hypothetical protein
MSYYKSIIRKVIESVHYHHRINSERVFINPEIRFLLKSKKTEWRKKIEEKVNKDNKDLSLLENNYEYKNKVFLMKIKHENIDKTRKLEHCNFDFIEDGSNLKFRYNKSIIKRLLYFPIYHLPKYFKSSYLFKLALFIICILCLKIGYLIGKKDCILYDPIKNNVIDIKNEDSLFDLLISLNKPLVVFYYFPENELVPNMQFNTGLLSEKYNDYATFAKVNCKYNLELCMKKAEYLKMPQWELMNVPVIDNGNKKFPIVPCVNERSYHGLEGFLMKENIIPDKYNPIQIINQGFDLKLNH